MEDIPEEILLNILNFCSGYSVFFSRTCHQWFRLGIPISKSNYLDSCFEDGNLASLKKLTEESNCHEVITSDRVHKAIQKDHLEIVQWVREYGYIFGNSELCSMAYCGRISMLKWIDSDPRTHHLLKQHGENISFYLAKKNRFEELKWFFSRSFKLHKFCPYHAAKNNNLPMIEWLAERACPLTEETIGGIGHGGSIEILAWTIANRYVDNFNKLLIKAASEGHLEMLHWVEKNLSEQFPLDKWNSDLCSYAAESGILEAVQWLKGKGFICDEKTCEFAASKGNFKLVQWLILNGCPCNEMVFFFAVEQEDLSLLTWMKRNKCPWNEDVCSNAASHGQLEALKWIRKNGCPWNEKTLVMAAESGQFETFVWAHQQKCPIDPSIVDAALFSGNLKLLDYLFQNNFCFGFSTVAAEEGNLEVLQWLHERSLPRILNVEEYQREICIQASERNHIHVLQWARNKQFKWDSQVTFNLAQHNNLIGLRWAFNQGCGVNLTMIEAYQAVIDPEICFWVKRMINCGLLADI
nr:ankyrin repeat protein [Pithovirus mammoth]